MTKDNQASNFCHHSNLSATFLGVDDQRYGSSVVHFRGIPYGVISKRFDKSTPMPKWNNQEVDATKFGPICPQPQVDVGHLLRLPEDAAGPQLVEDEFKCLNLNVHCPPIRKEMPNLPVLVWIHGGSQVITFAPASAPVCDPTRIVAQSISGSKPIVLVTFNYRLNIFAFGNGGEHKNLALKDQKLAIDWVINNISEFGGDPKNITLAGESAGAVYAHAHILTNAPVKRAILASGSLYLSPPLPTNMGDALIERVTKVVQDDEGQSLEDASATSLVKAISTCRINSMWLQEEPSLNGWQERVETVEAVLVGDVEYESVLWRNGIENMTADEIADCFGAAGTSSQQLSKIYHVNRDRPTQSKHAALDLINDARFGLPADEIYRRSKGQGKPTFQYVFDQPNPWQSSSRAHHAVDLIMLFGGIDLKQNSAAEQVGHNFRDSWIKFVNGEAPWSTSGRFAFGPNGKSTPLTDEEYSQRRRVHCYDLLRKMDKKDVNAAFGRLAAGRISLLN